MSPLVIQGDDASQQLVDQFGVKGRVPIMLDEIVVPTTDIGDFAGLSPYTRRRTGGDVLQPPAGGAAAYGGAYITPAPGSKLVVESVTLSNDTGVNLNVRFMLYTPANLAAVTLVGAATAVPRFNGRMRASGLIDSLAATDGIYHHTTVALGALFGMVYSISGQDRTFFLPRGIVLDGLDPAGPIRLAIQVATLNQVGPRINFTCVEYLAK